MSQSNASPQPQTPPVEHYDYRPMHAENLQSDPYHYERMVQLTDAIVNRDSQAVMNAAVADKANYVALADVCNDASRNTAAPANIYQVSSYILDTPIPRADKQIPGDYKSLFNYDTYVKEGMKAAADRSVKPERYSRDPEVAAQINDEIDSIKFYADYLAGNPRYGEFASKYAKAYEDFTASVPQNTDPEEYSKLYNEWIESDPNHKKWLEGAKRFQQEDARITPHLNRLAEIVDGNRDYGVLAQKKLEEIFGQETMATQTREKAGKTHAAGEARFKEAAERRGLIAHARSLKESSGAPESDVAELRYEELRVGPLQGREGAAANAAKGAMRKADIAINRATTLADRIRDNLETGKLRVRYEITPEERTEYRDHKQQLETMVREAVQMQHAHNTIEQEHTLFVARNHLQSYIALVEKRLQDADPAKHDPRYPELLAQYKDMVNLEGHLLYNTAAQRLARAQDPQNPGFKGRAEVVPMPDEGLLVKDNTNAVIFYPDGSRAYLQDDGTISSRAFENPYQTSLIPQPRQPEATPAPTRVERNAGAISRLLRRSHS